MSVLDPELQKAADAGIIYHNWMYSFMPAERGLIFLVGYCKQCRKAFSQMVKTAHMSAGKYVETEMQVPKSGCIPISE